ncbi:MAG: SLOG family protein [Bacteroidales bacterium]
MKIAIIGSRSFSDYQELENKVQKFLAEWNCELNSSVEIVSGGAAGADSLGAIFAKNHQLEMTSILPNWKKYGRGAGIVRNREIAETADAVIAFWDGTSKGTKSTIDFFRDQKKRIKIVRFAA